ncbi:hypothetical protein F5B22DRAFT_596002 [Xylaria bambusicola]|uniref:uncharacterized protein n=1 Tax=Xylaria bambusicola TaxID=326684 RepID=UPI002008A9FB|nr:uncharacterized protein F5B22DRAFT_596002 [Xylaria bambusicola]KAI0521723.1 hypothetical protein F5B22DRAFT_596002 [Xylaria bambusicola]
MDRRTYESPMDWEYQNTAPMDPSSPFAQSTRPAPERNPFGGSSSFAAYSQSGFGRAPMTPSKPLPPTPNHQQSPSIFASARSQAQRSTTASSFRNPAFTTPRKPFDPDALSEISASPAATDGGSDFPETPDHDQSIDMAQMTLTPASVSKHRSFSPKKASGRGEIAKPMFPTRDKVRKRKRYNGDKDISGYRLPYKQADEGDSDYESDDSTFQPNKPQHNQKRPKSGWFGNFLSALQQNPTAPRVLGLWLNFGFSLFCMSGTVWIIWAIVSGLRADFTSARAVVRDSIVNEMSICQTHYQENKCFPVEARLPGLRKACDEWEACMNQDPSRVKNVQLGAKSIVEVINEIVDTMSYKTIILLLFLFAIFVFSGRSLYKTAHDFPDFAASAPPTYGQPPPALQQVHWQALEPQTPSRRTWRHLPSNEETPETDGSPPRFKKLTAPETPYGSRSPTKTERGRSPAKSMSPTKRR